LRPEQRVAEEVLRAVQGPAIQAALQAAERAAEQQASRLRALQLELEQTRYQAGLAEKRYEAVDPENRLVADELETRWNLALRKVEERKRGCERRKPRFGPHQSQMKQLCFASPMIYLPYGTPPRQTYA
jgi:hypothetical protein